LKLYYGSLTTADSATVLTRFINRAHNCGWLGKWVLGSTGSTREHKLESMCSRSFHDVHRNNAN